MVSTLQPMHPDIKPPHEYPSYKSHPSRYSPPESPRHLPSFFASQEGNMNSRGLPPPLGMNFHGPDRNLSSASALGNLPAPPGQWTGQDESMRHWLQAKAEEDRRRQEEERTKQETLRLDQRKIEQSMLLDSLQGGIPPPMVPLIFAGMGGGNLPSHTLEWAQQYLAQLSIQNQQQQQQIQAQQQQIQQHQHLPQQPPPSSPDQRRDNRMFPPNPYSAQQPIQAALPSTSNQQPPPSRNGLQGQAPTSALSRLNTVDVQQMQSNTASARQTLHSGQQSATVPSDQSSGPGLFFHHWTPPSNSNSNQPPTPSGKSAQGSPFSQNQTSHLRADYQSSPKKRKTAGGQAVGVPATSQPMEPSPPPSSHLDQSPGLKSQRRPHSRDDSESSSRENDRPIARPSSRQQRADELSSSSHYPSRQTTGSSHSGSGQDRPMR